MTGTLKKTVAIQHAELTEAESGRDMPGGSGCCIKSFPTEVGEITAKTIKRFSPWHIPELAFMLGRESMSYEIKSALIEHCTAGDLHLLTPQLGRLDHEQVRRIYIRALNYPKHMLDIDNPIHRIKSLRSRHIRAMLNKALQTVKGCLPDALALKQEERCIEDIDKDVVRVDVVLAMLKRNIFPEAMVLRAIDSIPPERQVELVNRIHNLSNAMALKIAQKARYPKGTLSLIQHKLGSAMAEDVSLELMRRFPQLALELYSVLSDNNKTPGVTRMMVRIAKASFSTTTPSGTDLLFALAKIPERLLEDEILLSLLADWIKDTMVQNPGITQQKEVLMVLNMYTQKITAGETTRRHGSARTGKSINEEIVQNMQALWMYAREIYTSLKTNERTVAVTRECISILLDRFDRITDHEQKIGDFLNAVPRMVFSDHGVRCLLKDYLDRIKNDYSGIMKNRDVRAVYYRYLKTMETEKK